MAESVTQRVLGARFAQLDPRLLAYFSAPPEGCVGHGTGVYEEAGSRVRWLRPLWSWLAWRGVLFPELGRDIPFTTTNTPDGDGLRARRTFEFPGRSRVMLDRMSVVDGELHDRLGRRGGLEVRLALHVVDGGMRMRSERLWLRLGPLRLPLPPLAVVELDERIGPAGRQRVDLRMRAPLLGEVFRYTGSFDYRIAPRQHAIP
ncbi:DUF4166 domain-containing protein [Homoserinibacter sp. YIM 151385]|uniref:DUF4166 domain-containing protein n=1 Tax=Homoserinibacter sp. YIM 151385 TaxID=2985506 RepID=UPI0022F09CBD|nr:DUF4166 domain-containing protein [Homoserinibacter sp. YIM 151385]WBU37750.1 DUF4166 domain-containing protein [Homoserinibacter sp. YIM 151385]